MIRSDQARRFHRKEDLQVPIADLSEGGRVGIWSGLSRIAGNHEQSNVGLVYIENAITEARKYETSILKMRVKRHSVAKQIRRD